MRSFFLFLFYVFYLSPIWGIESEVISTTAEEVLKKGQIPGIVVVIVQDNQPSFIKAFGNVNAKSPFEIASLTKAFTAYSMTRIKGLDFDQPIREYDASFKLSKEDSSNRCTLRALLSHQSGLSSIAQQSWRLWVRTNRTRQDLLDRLQFVPLLYPLRTHFSYNNMNYVAAAEAVSKKLGKDWNTYFQTVLAELGLTQSAFGKNELLTMLPAMGLISCGEDMEKWLRFCLSDSKPLKETFIVQCPVSRDGFFPPQDQMLWPLYFHEASQVSYALGWMHYKVNGYQIYGLFGTTENMQSMLAICPQKKCGVVVLTNKSYHPGASILVNTILDELLELPKKDWLGFLENLLLQRKKWIEDYTDWFNKQKNSAQAPKPPFRKYSGTYENLAYGQIRINEKGEYETFAKQKGKIIPWAKDTFSIEGYDELPTLVEFKENSLLLPYLPPFCKR